MCYFKNTYKGFAKSLYSLNEGITQNPLTWTAMAKYLKAEYIHLYFGTYNLTYYACHSLRLVFGVWKFARYRNLK